MIGDTSKFKVLDVLFDKNNFAIARGYWDGDNTKLRLACRWHDAGIGYPQTFGKPQWMMLPDEPDLSLQVTKTFELSQANPQTKVVITLT
jgi:hypothetical protein